MEYMVFLSYRHADNAEEDRQWATWLHQTLEIYDVPEELVGTINSRGEIIPERIYPVFRDEVSLPASADLRSAIHAAIEQSRFMVVLCSPRAVQSAYVADEITRFKALGNADRLMAAILLGEPKASMENELIEDPEDVRTLECFPVPLRYVVDQNGSIQQDKPTEPLAVDFRLPDGKKGVTNPEAYKHQLIAEGKPRKRAEQLAADYEYKLSIAKLKLIAGILGVPLDVLIDRDKAHRLRKAESERRRATQRAAVMAFFLVVAAIAWFQVWLKNDALSEATALAVARADEALRESRAAKSAESIVLSEKALEVRDPWVRARIALRGLPRKPDFADRPLVADAFNVLAPILDDNIAAFPNFPVAPREVLHFPGDRSLQEIHVSNDMQSLLFIQEDAVHLVGALGDTIHPSVQAKMHDGLCELSRDLRVIACSEAVALTDNATTPMLRLYDTLSGKISAEITNKRGAVVSSVNVDGTRVLLRNHGSWLDSIGESYGLSKENPIQKAPPGGIAVWHTDTNRVTTEFAFTEKKLQSPNGSSSDSILSQIAFDREYGTDWLMNASGNRVIVKQDNKISIIDASDGRLIRSFASDSGITMDVLADDNGSQVVLLTRMESQQNSGSQSSQPRYLVEIRSLHDGELVWSFQTTLKFMGSVSDRYPATSGWTSLHNASRYGIRADRKGRLFAVVDRDGVKLVRRAQDTGKTSEHRLLRRTGTQDVLFSPDSQYLVVLDRKGSAHIINTETLVRESSITLDGYVSNHGWPWDDNARRIRAATVDENSNLILVGRLGFTQRTSLNYKTVRDGLEPTRITGDRIENWLEEGIDNPILLGADGRTLLSLSSRDNEEGTQIIRKHVLDTGMTQDLQIDWDWSDAVLSGHAEDMSRILMVSQRQSIPAVQVLDLTQGRVVHQVVVDEDAWLQGNQPEPFTSSLSTDGKKLAYCKNEQGESSSYTALMIRDLDTDVSRALFDTRKINEIGFGCVASQWLKHDSLVAVILDNRVTNVLAIIDVKTGSIVRLLPLAMRLEHNFYTRVFAASSDGRYLPVLDYENDVLHVVDAETGVTNLLVSVSSLQELKTYWLQNGKRLFISEDDDEGYIVDVSSGRVEWRAPKSNDGILASGGSIWMQREGAWLKLDVDELAGSPDEDEVLDLKTLSPGHWVDVDNKRFMEVDKQEDAGHLVLSIVRSPWRAVDTLTIPFPVQAIANTRDEGLFAYVAKNKVRIVDLLDGAEQAIDLPEAIFRESPRILEKNASALHVGEKARLLVAHNASDLFILDQEADWGFQHLLEGEAIRAVRIVGEDRVLALIDAPASDRGQSPGEEGLWVIEFAASGGKFERNLVGTSLLSQQYDQFELFPGPTGYFLLAAKGSNNYVAYRLVREGAPILMHSGSLGAVPYIGQSESLRWIAINTSSGVDVYDLVENRLRHQIQHKEGSIAHAFSPGGDRLVTGSALDGIRLFDTESGANLGYLRRPGPVVSALLFDDEGSTVAAFAKPHHVFYLSGGSGEAALQIADLRMRIPKVITDRYLRDRYVAAAGQGLSDVEACTDAVRFEIKVLSNAAEQHLSRHLDQQAAESKENSKSSELKAAASKMAHAVRLADTRGCNAELVTSLLVRQSRISSGLSLEDSAQIWFETDNKFAGKRMRL